VVDPVERVESFILTLPRDEPYLGALRPGEKVNAKGYFVRNINRTVYPVFDRMVFVRITSKDGAMGWGETFGIVAPGAAKAIIDDLLAEYVRGRDPMDAAAIHDDLYDLMRVRGYTGGFYMDALAAIDIALWDLAARRLELPLAKLLGGRRRERIPAYVSGLPKPTLEERVAFAEEWTGRGFSAVKFAAAVADDGSVKELEALRRALGSDIEIACDMHWQYSPAEAVRVIRMMEPYRPWFIEAPVKPEDIEGQAEVARKIDTPLALGEEWRGVHEARPRFERRAVGILQPEIGHIGVTQFTRLATLAQTWNVPIIPHAAGSLGIFLAASLQASATLHDLPSHEFQHSIMLRNRDFLDVPLTCEAGFYQLPRGPGLGTAPNAEAMRLMEA